MEEGPFRGNQGLVPTTPPGALSSVTSIEQQRAIQEVQGMMIMAKKFPRDEALVEEKIRQACRRKSLAEVARYIYPKGGTTVQGPSIRLAETIARLWGNMLYGIQELSRSPGSSEMEAYAWDLESNTRRSIKFKVEHIRWTKKGSYDLEDPRDIYEMNANMGARRVRACIQGVVPADIFDMAEEECDKTLNASLDGKPEERIAAMKAKYQEIGVPVEALEKRLGHKIEATTNPEIIVLRKIFMAIRDGMGKKEDYFEIASGTQQKSEEKANALKEKLRQAQENEKTGQGSPDPDPPPHSDGDEPTLVSPPSGDPAGEEAPPPPPPEPPKQEAPKAKKEPDTFGPKNGPKIEAGKKAQDYWMPNSTDMVKCPTGGERANQLTKTVYCNQTCKFRKRCFVFTD